VPPFPSDNPGEGVMEKSEVNARARPVMA